MSKQDRSGFTLVELLVVITIIGMLVALLVNAVISAREAARQTQCMKNQNELHTAIFNYELSKKRYPGYLNSGGKTWPMELFKGLGLTRMHEEFLTGADGGSTEAKTAVVRQFVCPDDRPSEESPLSYVANTGQLGNDREPAKAYGIFHDLANPPSDGQVVKVTSSDIRDGANQTLLISERGSDLNQTGESGRPPRKWFGEWAEEQLGFSWVADGGKVRDHIRSYHPDISVVTFCGGNQKKLSLDIKYYVYAMLMTPDGSKVEPVQTDVFKEGDY